jgi:DNA polymerase elongation subunit (family B)
MNPARRIKMHDFIIVNGDTDSIAFKKRDQKPITPGEQAALLAEINGLMPELIHWEHDSYFKKFIVVAAKNYIMLDEKGKLKIKGSGLKATTKEKALQAFIREVIDLLLADRKDHIMGLYQKYARNILGLTEVSQWCSKVTITKAVLSGEGTRQVRIRQAIGSKPVQEGDKIWIFNKTEDELCLLENFNGEYHVDTMLGKLYDTLTVFDAILDIDCFPNLTLKRNKPLMGELR